jgi:hypothetical protein
MTNTYSISPLFFAFTCEKKLSSRIFSDSLQVFVLIAHEDETSSRQNKSYLRENEISLHKNKISSHENEKSLHENKSSSRKNKSSLHENESFSHENKPSLCKVAENRCALKNSFHTRIKQTRAWTKKPRACLTDFYKINP